jgi:hypothetical protein
MSRHQIRNFARLIRHLRRTDVSEQSADFRNPLLIQRQRLSQHSDSLIMMVQLMQRLSHAHRDSGCGFVDEPSSSSPSRQVFQHTELAALERVIADKDGEDLEFRIISIFETRRAKGLVERRIRPPDTVLASVVHRCISCREAGRSGCECPPHKSIINLCKPKGRFAGS